VCWIACCWYTPWGWQLGTERCTSWHRMLSVFYNVYYCILISAFCWFKIMERWGEFILIVWLNQTWFTHSSQHYFHSCCHGVCWTLFQSPLIVSKWSVFFTYPCWQLQLTP
jgi:hypothetical protein